MRIFAICLAIIFVAIPEILGFKKFPTATKPPPPPPAPPLVVFDQSHPGQSEPPPKARFEYFELIAPSQNGQNYNPTLTISNPDFNVSYKPRPQPQIPQRPQIPQPQRPQRPQQQFQQPQRPTSPPLFQFPQQQRPQRPQRPNSQLVARPQQKPGTGSRPPPPPRNQLFPDPGHRFGPQAFNQLQQQPA